nr:unknown [Zea mays]
MCGCISMGILWFRNNTPTQSTRQEKARKDKAKRPRPKLSTSLFGEPSVPDVDPKDARQWEMSSSDSD